MRELLSSVPEYRERYFELLETFGDEETVGTHVVFGDLFDFCLDSFRQSQSTGSLSRVLQFMERATVAGDSEVRNLVVVSFLEHLWKATPLELSLFTERMGPGTLQLLEQVDMQ